VPSVQFFFPSISPMRRVAAIKNDDVAPAAFLS